MKATTQLRKLGQSIWLDNISRDLLNSGTLKTYIDEFSVTGLTSNPTIFDQDARSRIAKRYIEWVNVFVRVRQASFKSQPLSI